ncbi:signal transducer and activator of transcription 2 isoform X2 [Neoarius graeffei]|uniref:signal transducer and activator of transcription 2 isoform X2 n=1 Tax=Neoarius graeffei TaxID=443677 RepID=UPI00298C29D2|nr:signal transducer and activator of transcription 2 isoform X2 [Neoarius graeffei]
MAQWERLKQLDSVCLQKVDELYHGDSLPMAVREYLAHWIEEQDWERALRDSSRAVVLFQILLENLDNQYSRFVQENNFLMHRNFRHFKQQFQQRYQEDPCNLAETINWFLMKEQEILGAAELAQEVQMLQVQQSSMESETQKHLEKNIRDFKSKVQVMEHSLRCLEEQQDEFDFKYQTYQMDGTTDETEKNEQIKMLKMMLNRLNAARKSFLLETASLLDSVDHLLAVLLEELQEWKRRQQVSCIGALEDTNLEPLEKWFTAVGDGMLQLRKFLQKLEELHDKLSYDEDPIKTQKPILQERVDTLLTTLLKSAFVVETQPSMPQGRGPLVLRTSVQFSVKTRFLFKVPELNHAMKVSVSINKDVPNVKGYRKFNVLGTSSKALNMSESMNGGMVADFRHLTLKERKVGAGGKGSNDLSLSVTEELHTIHFETQFNLHGLSVPLETCSLPVVVISNSSQQQSAWASVLWFNLLSTDPKNLVFFASSPVATWSQLGQMLNWQFQSCAKRGLDANQLRTLAQKLFGKQENYENSKISWTRFSKENISGQNFTLWVWLDGILNLVKVYLANMWEDGSIMGFVSKGMEKVLLKKKQGGTFLLRFSESIRDGGITFSWVEYSTKGEPTVRTVQPFTSVDLKQIPFPEILRNFQIMEAENAPVYPLQFLYPNTPKNQAFGKYYNEKTGEESPYIKYIKTKLVFVSKENGCTSAPEGPAPDLCAQHNEPPSPPDVNTDVMLRGLESSPMLSGYSDSPTPPSSVPETSLSEIPENLLETLDLVTDPFADVPLKGSRSPGPLLDIFEALSPDTCMPTLQEFLNDPNLLDGYKFTLRGNDLIHQDIRSILFQTNKKN